MLPGEKVFVRTVTYHHVGEIQSVSKKWLVLKGASWVADSGRFGEALRTGTLAETEPFVDPVWISVGSIVDVTMWNHELPKLAK